MPTYDYRCDACGHEWEVFHSMSAKPKRKCPECGKLKAKRQIGAGAGIIFKGGGFYRSDSYKKGAAADKKSQETKSESSQKSESSKKSDTKKADS